MSPKTLVLICIGLINLAASRYRPGTDKQDEGSTPSTTPDCDGETCPEPVFDCKIDGCSGELCLDFDSEIGSSCIFKCEYNCNDYRVCQKNDGKCQWSVSDDKWDNMMYGACMAICQQLNNDDSYEPNRYRPGTDRYRPGTDRFRPGTDRYRPGTARFRPGTVSGAQRPGTKSES